jgi:hypothetical protein
MTTHKQTTPRTRQAQKPLYDTPLEKIEIFFYANLISYKLKTTSEPTTNNHALLLLPNHCPWNTELQL